MKRATRAGAARGIVAHHIFGWLVDVDGLDAQVRAPLKVVLEDAGDRGDFSRGERIKWVADRETGSIERNIFRL